MIATRSQSSLITVTASALVAGDQVPKWPFKNSFYCGFPFGFSDHLQHENYHRNWRGAHCEEPKRLSCRLVMSGCGRAAGLAARPDNSGRSVNCRLPWSGQSSRVLPAT
jgi:hypothetical protein